MKLIILQNPFNIAGREVKDLTYIPGKKLSEYVQPYIMGLPYKDFCYAVNGEKKEADYIPDSIDYIAICPVVGKGSLLGSILSIGLAIVTGGIAAGGIAAWGLAGGTFLAGLTAAAVGYIGGILINHICPMPKTDFNMSDLQNSVTYGWGEQQTSNTQGGCLPVTYGSMYTAGTELARHVDSDGEQQYLNLIVCGGEGPVDSIEDITINDNPIENYEDVEIETRLGTNDQDVIANFNDTYADQSLEFELLVPEEKPAGVGDVSNPKGFIRKKADVPLTSEELAEIQTLKLNLYPDSDYSTQQIEGNSAQGLEISFQFPNGLYHMNDNGSIGNASVVIYVQYKKEDATEWGNWILTKIEDNDNATKYKKYRIDNLQEGRYTVRCLCLYKSGDTTRDATRIYWFIISSIVYDDFCRPNKVLISIRALATSQLSNSISIRWKQTVEYVNVFNPNTNAYELKSARNPAWVAYDMLHQCKKLKNIHTGNFEYVVRNIPANQIDYQAFADWSEYCDTLGLNFEHIFDTVNDLWEALKTPETFGRGKVLMRGTKYSCICDKPSEPVQMFTVGNILQDSYSKEYSVITDRANAIEITFINKAKNYQKDVITVYGDDYDNEEIYQNPTQVTLYGCTDYEQAYKYGKYQLRVNKKIRTCTWDADIDAIACQVGDVVLLSHDVPQWGLSGRLLYANTNHIKLDRLVNMVSGKQYAIIVRMMDDTLITKNIVFKEGETDYVEIAEAFEEIPEDFCIYAFGEVNKMAKPFTIVDTSRKDDLTVSLTGVEYLESTYEETQDVPDIDYTVPVTSYEVEDLTAREETYIQDNNIRSDINISWQMPRGGADKVNVYYSVDGGNVWTLYTTTSFQTARISNLNKGTYYIKVCVVNSLGAVSKGVVAVVNVTGTITDIDITVTENKVIDYTSSDWQQVNFTNKFKDVPSLFVIAQTENGIAYTKNITTTGFEVKQIDITTQEPLEGQIMYEAKGVIQNASRNL
jgi:predicted phage tail protein|nr:MAG TPA: tail component [Caudoviricetes sp.]